MTTSSRPVRVRIAPSPTGDPHVGTAYIALFNYVFARQQGGAFILRIEDTDQARARSDSEAMIFDALRWVGLTWDEGPDIGGPYGPYRQSERKAHYVAAAGDLLLRGKAYRCFCTGERLTAIRAAQVAEKRSFIGYDRHCRAIDAAESERKAAAGEAHTVRLATPLTGTVVVKDQLRGEVSFDVGQLDDQVLLKSDGMPTYHLANVVDDHLMEITHVIRAEEWISSTPKHVLLYAAFGWEEPAWHHMPLLRNADKSKISKRKNPVSINYYRDAGILPHALCNFLGLMGWSFGDDREKFTLAEMVASFSWDKISLGGPVFNLDKLTWLNEKYIHELGDLELADALLAWRLRRDHLARIVPLVRQRIKRLDEFVPMTEYFFSGDLDYAAVAAELVIPDVAPAEVAAGLLAFVDRIEARDGWDGKALEEEGRTWATERNWKTKHAFMLLRLVVTGRKASPPLFDTMVVLGKEVTRRRLRQAADLIGRSVSSAAEVQSVLQGLGVALVVAAVVVPLIVRSYRRGGALGRVVAKLTIDQWRAIDEDDGPGANRGPRAFDWKVAVILVTVCLSLTLQEYVGQRELYRVWFPEHARDRYVQLQAFAWWSGWRVVGYVLIPMLVILALPGERLRDYHISLRGFLKHLWIYALMFGLILPAVFLASRTDSFRSTYPFYSWANRSMFDLWAWEVMYAIQFLALEFFFRGFILHGLRRALGSNAILVMIVPYCMIHYGKPMSETFGAVGAGLILGTLAMRTRSIWGGVVIHVGVAWTMDLLAVSQCPPADSGRPCPVR